MCSYIQCIWCHWWMKIFDCKVCATTNTLSCGICLTDRNHVDMLFILLSAFESPSWTQNIYYMGYCCSTSLCNAQILGLWCPINRHLLMWNNKLFTTDVSTLLISYCFGKITKKNNYRTETVHFMAFPLQVPVIVLMPEHFRAGRAQEWGPVTSKQKGS